MTGCTVHVVDDEEPIRRSLALMLRVLGHLPLLYPSGSDFLEALPKIQPGCVLLDLRMADVDGFEVQRRMLAANARHSVIVMSGHGELSLAVTAMEQGAIDFLEKPFARSALEDALKLGFMRLDDEAAYRDYLRECAAKLHRMSGNDRTILDLLSRGHDAETIERETGTSTQALERSTSRIFAELGTSDLLDALRVVFAARRAAAI